MWSSALEKKVNFFSVKAEHIGLGHNALCKGWNFIFTWFSDPLNPQTRINPPCRPSPRKDEQRQFCRHCPADLARSSHPPSGSTRSQTTPLAPRTFSQKRIRRSPPDSIGYKHSMKHTVCGAPAKPFWSATSTATHTFSCCKSQTRFSNCQYSKCASFHFFILWLTECVSQTRRLHQTRRRRD